MKSSGERGIFFRGVKSLFQIFSQCEICFFLVKIVHFNLVDLNQILVVSKSDKLKKPCSFLYFFPFNFQFSTSSLLPFQIFSIFPFFLAPLFLTGKQKNSRWKMWGEHSAPCPVTPLMKRYFKNIWGWPISFTLARWNAKHQTMRARIRINDTNQLTGLYHLFWSSHALFGVWHCLCLAKVKLVGHPQIFLILYYVGRLRHQRWWWNLD